MKKYKVLSESYLTNDYIAKLIQDYKTTEVPRLNKLYDYYLGKTDILKKTTKDPSKPNNKVVSPHSKYISDTTTSYFIASPVVYNSKADTELLQLVSAIFALNDEHALNSQIAKHASIMGAGYELNYLDENGDYQLASLDPREVFLIYDSKIKGNVIAGVRFYSVNMFDEKIEYVEVYYKDRIEFGVLEGNQLTIDSENTAEHYFNEVPIIQYLNNDEGQGDFEQVIALIDAYDTVVSATTDDIEYFSDSYMIISGTNQYDVEEFADMRENKIILAGENGKVEWLVKDQTNQQVEEYKNRLKNDIYTLAQVPNLSDESFANSQSGESMKYKLFSLESLTAIKERNFKKALQKRIKLITETLNKKRASALDYTEIKMKFSRNMPSNLTNLADVTAKLKGTLSDHTLLSLLPFIESPDEEMEKVKAERQDPFYSEMEQLEGDA